MKRYARYMCSACFRTLDKLVNAKQVSLDTCSITLKCSGRLSLVGYLNNAMIMPSQIAGLDNWHSRWDAPSKDKIALSPELINTSTSENGTLVLAIAIPKDADSAVPLQLVLQQQDEKPKDYKQFMFRFENSTKIISGIESGLEKKALRYSVDDDIDVYVNGLIQEEGTGDSQYQRCLPGNGVPQNTIRFNNDLINGGQIIQVDVIISQKREIVEVIIDLMKNTYDNSDTSRSSWKNVQSIIIPRGNVDFVYELYHFDLSSGFGAVNLKKNSILVPSRILFNNTELSKSNAFILFAYSPYEHIDREYMSYARLSDFDIERDYFKCAVNEDGIIQLSVTSTCTSGVYPPLRPVTFTPDAVLKTASAGNGQRYIHSTTINGPAV